MAASSIGSPTKLGPIGAWTGVDSGPPEGVERNGKGKMREESENKCEKESGRIGE